MSATAEVFCGGCGNSLGRKPEYIETTRCWQCPPETCTTCGGINYLRDDIACSCWISVSGMAPADLKALFAADGTFNVETDGTLTIGAR